VVHHCVRSRNLVNEEALAHWGLLLEIKINQTAEEIVVFCRGKVSADFIYGAL
jgi:hypothetical protein